MDINNLYPLSRIFECIDSLGESRIFSTLDAFNGYWKVDVAEKG